MVRLVTSDERIWGVRFSARLFLAWILFTCVAGGLVPGFAVLRPFQAAAQVLEDEETLPGPTGLFIKTAPPARRLIAADVSGFTADLLLTLTSLQGVVNQTEPRIFLLDGGYSRTWVEWLKERGDIDEIRYLSSVQAATLVGEFKDELNGQVVVDPKIPATLNLATMISGLDRLLITYPRYAETYAEWYDLPIVVDLRDRFTTNAEAYRWALEHLWPRLNHHALAMLHPEVSHPRDFLIQQKVWVWWLSGTVDGGSFANRFEELKVAFEVLQGSPVNIPVLGYPWHGDGVGPGEHGGVDLFSRYGKFLIPSDYARNLSVHAHARPPAPRALASLTGPGEAPSEFEGAPRARLNSPNVDPERVYLTVVVSDGDNVQAWLNYFPRYFETPAGRTVPVAWTISPAALDLVPAVVDYVAARRLPGDAFLAAVSGIGYVYLDRYGADTPDQEKTRGGFLRLTSDYMKRLGLTMIWPMVPDGPVKRDVLSLYAEGIPHLRAIFPDYGQKVVRYADATYVLEAGGRRLPVFHAMGGDTPLHASIQRALSGAPRPAFAHAFALNWNVSPADLAALAGSLGDEYAIVSPDALVELFWASQSPPGH